MSPVRNAYLVASWALVTPSLPKMFFLCVVIVYSLLCLIAAISFSMAQGYEPEYLALAGCEFPGLGQCERLEQRLHCGGFVIIARFQIHQHQCVGEAVDECGQFGMVGCLVDVLHGVERQQSGHQTSPQFIGQWGQDYGFPFHEYSSLVFRGQSYGKEGIHATYFALILNAE